MPEQVLQIVPKLPPAIDGVGDYSLNLARQFRKNSGIETCFVVGDPSWSGASEIEGFSVLQVKERSPEVLCALLSNYPPMPVLLHYVGYGYAKRGCPLWLANGLQDWQANYPNSKLVTMFHEVYALGAPWTSSFWLSPLQKYIASQLVRMSDRVLTSNQFMKRILTHLSAHTSITVSTLPVFSTIGESESLPTLCERQRQLVVFGHRNSRLQVYQQCQVALEQVCRALKIEAICDIGTPTGLDFSSCISVPVVEKGITDAAEVSSILTNAVAGFLNFPPPRFLAKSTVFASYCAHGVIPCMVNSSSESIDGLIGGKQYWAETAPNNSLSLDTAQTIADNAHTWYQTHNITVQAKTFTSHLELLK